jgi:hypothetical protein
MLRTILIALAALAAAPTAAGAVLAYPAAQTIPASGPLPGGSGAAIGVNAAIGEREGAWIVVTGASSVAASIDGGQLGPLKAALSFGHFVAFGSRAVADALIPWDGSAHPTEKPNQPLYLQVVVPEDARPGVYGATVHVTADGRRSEVPIAIRVFPVRLPRPGAAEGSLLGSFHLVPETYVNKVDELYHLGSNAAKAAANESLFSFLSAYRISPSSWGFGEPRSPDGYTASSKWWLDATGNMVRENLIGFGAMRIPISNQRASQGNRIAGISPFAIESWCGYLQSVRGFWEQRGWLQGRVPYLYALDEPSRSGMKLVAQQAASAHSCFPGARVLLTGNPDRTNRFLWDGRNQDDVDIWAVLSRRYYGRFNHPRQSLRLVEQARRAGKMIWSYSYTGIAGTPGYGAVEPLSNPRLLLLWNALEGIQGTLYGQGMTSYTAGSPLDSVGAKGEFVLLYPDRSAPIPSARLEQIRDGIEDWGVLDLVRRKHGLPAVRMILARAGLFSASASSVELACTAGCDLHGSTKYAWPQWSHDAATATKIEVAHLAALRAAS